MTKLRVALVLAVVLLSGLGVLYASTLASEAWADWAFLREARLNHLHQQRQPPPPSGP